jgi:hypothetical protein
MAAISALLMATAKVFPEADIFVGPNPHAETIEFIDSYAKHLRRVDLGRSLNAVTPSPKLRSKFSLSIPARRPLLLTPRLKTHAAWRERLSCLD